MTPPPSSEPEATPEEYRQRALLFADLGRYDDAAEEIASGLTGAPGDPGLLATLARVHLAAEQPAEALVAADRAVAASPGTIDPLVVRAMALSDVTRYADAAQVATEMLRRWPDDPYALRTGAALLGESRNGQTALDAAWNAVRVAPADAEAHLVLAVVAARLRLFDLAQRAYGEALDLDARIGDAQHDVGIVRLERRRWARALESLADEASLRPGEVRSDPDDRRDLYPDAAPIEPAVDKPAVDWPVEPTVSRPTRPVLDPSERSAAATRQAILFGANATIVAAVLTAAMTLASTGAARVWAGIIGALLFLSVPIWLSRRLIEPTAAALAKLRATDRRLAIGAYLAFAAPLLVICYAVVGGPATLVAVIVVATLAELIAVLHRRR